MYLGCILLHCDIMVKCIWNFGFAGVVLSHSKQGNNSSVIRLLAWDL